MPAPHARSPWAADMLHGRLLGGLAARAIERLDNDPELLCSRLTVDLFRAPPMAPVQVSTEVARDGRRVRSVDVHITSGGVEVARASCLLLRRAEQPAGTVWTAPEWSVPRPEDLPAPEAAAGLRPMGWDMRPITPEWFGSVEQKRTWLREMRELVAGEPMSRFVRVAVAADFANPFANSGDQGLQFINADITLYLRRVPVSDWIGFEVAGHLSQDGVAVGQCTLYDTDGAIGSSTVCSVTQARLTPS